MLKLKRLLIVLFLTTLFFNTIFAEETVSEQVWWGSYYGPGNFIADIHVGFESGMGTNAGSSVMGVSVYPAVEISLYKPRIVDIAPIDIGVTALGHFGLGFGDVVDGNIALGAGLMGSVHFGFVGLDVSVKEHLEALDLFISAGIAFDFLKYDAGGALGFASISGVNYFLNDTVSVTAAYTHWRGLNGICIGINFRLGPKAEVGSINYALETDPDFNVSLNLDSLYYQVYLAQFYSIYYYSFFAGGFFVDDSSYEEGDGTKWEITSSERSTEKESLIIEKSLLKNNIDGSRWWKMKFSSDGEEIVYEFLMNTGYNLLKMRFTDPETAEIREYIAQADEVSQYEADEVNIVTVFDYKDQITETKTITVAAGSFKADHIVNPAAGDQYLYEWWISSDVPGSMVKFMWKDSDSNETSGELIKITRGNTTELDSF